MNPATVESVQTSAMTPLRRQPACRPPHGWTLPLAAVLLLTLAEVTLAEALPRAAVFSGRLPGHDAYLAREIGAQVSASGYNIEFISLPTLTNASALSTQRFDLLVLPGARSLPAVAAASVEGFLRAGGDLLALGLPAWDSALFNLNGSWVSRAGFDAAIAAQKPQHFVFDFAKADLRDWRRTTDDPNTKTAHETVAAGSGWALRVAMEKLSGWDTFMSPPLTNPFPPGHTLTCFRAKGNPHTKQLALEWTERDGSRWIATVDLTSEWKDYVLPPEAFRAWQPPPARSGKSDCFQPQHAARFVVGLAHSHTALERGPYEYWIADIGTAPSPFDRARLPGGFKPPHLESVSPGYQFFPITTRAVIEQTEDVAAPVRAPGGCFNWPPRADRELTNAAAQNLLGFHPRPRGVGFNQERAYRWERLLAARDAKNNDHRGAVAALLVHAQPPFQGGVWAVFTPSDAAFYRQRVVRDCLRQTLARMRRGVFLIEGGAEFFTVFEDQNVPLGARVVSLSETPPKNLVARLAIREKVKARNVFLKERRLSCTAEQMQAAEERWMPSRWPEGGFEVSAELLLDGEVVDRLTHELHVWRPKTQPEFINVRDGGLWLRGKPWRVNGVNYMPSSGIGLANWRHFEHWVGRGAYDPEVTERDLQRVKAMDLNAVSVFIYHESLGAQHMLDFLRRCEALGLRVNLSLRPGTPMNFRWNEMRELIEYYRLAQNDTVFAYDLAWEPSHGGQEQQQRAYGGLWPAWGERRYGSVDRARRAWGVGGGDFEFEISNLKSLPVPPMKWLTQDGPWRNSVADYRRFLDELLGERYAEARRLVKSIDPNHAVSFRMQHAGDPTFNWEAFLPYDFRGLARAVDIWEPEAYGRIGDWEKVKPGRFTADYARLCDPEKPLVWAEMGCSVWDNHHMRPAPEKLEFQARYFSDFYRMMTESGADGIFFWWYPGGYRLNEQSDFGIINPDGTDRSVTKVIREQGGRFLKAPKPTWTPDHWITVDRDHDARGLFGIYEAVKHEYWRAIESGKTPVLKR